ncbi:MAG: hypothetical protein A2790_20115 [Phenylobacterium sp. RIFCSPHIGHO2_01_FULL_69_31]|uniref:sigma factor-like helix-turn-helix DNA-binding protein n=1 Tax=Phenylobacterium sp. RIFCSPHIGHO2_01_FULL_69_31 TaxID=1801944 RepID=UPI0008C75FEE|nr:sigma factor-like helix-turn-helix DNA-binding protein [Phenylobacterium sp. RIFCSPHIGHO2_01_FULL_69_31]OHB26273.1 MAG: hypothetical protein A2790_20115 [Phenylobacterium sp. RIFCSPHIGHO2_01_FULL_69_31]
MDEGEPLDLGSEPDDPLIFDLVTRNATTVRLSNAIIAARGRGDLPLNRLSTYLDAGDEAPEVMRRRVPNLGARSVAELDALLRRAHQQLAAEPRSTRPLERLDLRAALASCAGAQPCRESLAEAGLPLRLWNALGRLDLLALPVCELLLRYVRLEPTLLQLPNVGRTSFREGRRVLGEHLQRRLVARGMTRALADEAEAVVLDNWDPDPRTCALLEASLAQLRLLPEATEATEATEASDDASSSLSVDEVREALAAGFAAVTTGTALTAQRPPARFLGQLEALGYLDRPLQRLMLEYPEALVAMQRRGNFGATSSRLATTIMREILRLELSSRGFEPREIEVAQLVLLENAPPASDDFRALCRRVAQIRTAVAGAVTEEPRAEVASEPAEALLPRLLASLADRERDVLERRYGLYAAPLTLEEVGVIYGLTRERIRQIEKKALGRLRQVAPKRLRACCQEHGAAAWAALSGGEPFVLVSEAAPADRRVSPWMLLAMEACGLTVPAWLDVFADRRSGYWLPRGTPHEALEAAAERLDARLASQPRPCAIAQLAGEDDEALVRAALRLRGWRLFGDYVMPQGAGPRLRRAARLHSLLGQLGLTGIPELMTEYRARAADDPCGARDAEIVMQSCRHLFIEATEGCWAAIGLSGETPVVAAQGTDRDEEDDEPDGGREAADAEETRTDGTIASALESELREAGPLRISELQERAPGFLPPGRSINSLGPILLTNKDRFARPLPGFYALPDQIPRPAQLLARAPTFMLNEDQVRYYVLGRRAGEPRESFPLWSVEAECAWAPWVRRHAESVLLESFLHVAEPDAWPASVADQADWKALKAERGRFGLASPPITDGVERPDLDKLLAACLHARRHGGLGWISANRILWRRITEFAAAGMLAMMVAVELLEPADDWQAPHHPGPALEDWIAQLEATLARTGKLEWSSPVGEALLSAARVSDLGWADQVFVTRLFGRVAPVREPAKPEDPLAQLLAERERARQTSEFEARLRAAVARPDDEDPEA